MLYMQARTHACAHRMKVDGARRGHVRRVQGDPQCREGGGGTGRTEGDQLSSPPTPMWRWSRNTCTAPAGVSSYSCLADLRASRLYLRSAQCWPVIASRLACIVHNGSPVTCLFHHTSTRVAPLSIGSSRSTTCVPRWHSQGATLILPCTQAWAAASVASVYERHS